MHHQLVVLTDGKPENTKVYLYERRIAGLQDIKFTLSIDDSINYIPICDLSFIPIQSSIYSDNLEDDLKKFENDLIIKVSPSSLLSEVTFNNKPIKYIQKLEFIADMEEIIVNFEVINDNNEIQQIKLEDLLNFTK